jgi:hypothetical protein
MSVGRTRASTRNPVATIAPSSRTSRRDNVQIVRCVETVQNRGCMGRAWSTRGRVSCARRLVQAIFVRPPPSVRRGRVDASTQKREWSSTPVTIRPSPPRNRVNFARATALFRWATCSGRPFEGTLQTGGRCVARQGLTQGSGIGQIHEPAGFDDAKRRRVCEGARLVRMHRSYVRFPMCAPQRGRPRLNAAIDQPCPIRLDSACS